jgi:hypothetical protein
MTLPTLALVTPAMASANNGNWQTAQRWARLLRDHYVVRLMAQWRMATRPDDRAARAALGGFGAAWHATRFGGRRPLVLVLTGTDLYRDIAEDDAALSARWHWPSGWWCCTKLVCRTCPNTAATRRWSACNR